MSKYLDKSLNGFKNLEAEGELLLPAGGCLRKRRMVSRWALTFPLYHKSSFKTTIPRRIEFLKFIIAV